MGRRIQKKDLIDPNNTTRYYYNNNWQVLAEYDGSDTLQRYFVYGNYIDEVLLMKVGENDYYYAHDHLYSSAALIDTSGTVLERYEYDAYGNPTIWNADFTTERDNSNYGNPYLFTGRRVDILDSGSLKIQYNRNRYYDYYTGRWLAHDPSNYVDSMNLYEYCTSQPFSAADPWGLLGISFPPIPIRIRIPTPGPIPIPITIRIPAERVAKEAAYRVMWVFLWARGASHWHESLSHWFHEKDPPTLEITDPEDERIKDLKYHSGVRVLAEAWVAKKFCRMKIRESKWYKVKDHYVHYEFKYPFRHPVGGWSAHRLAGLVYVGSWDATFTVKKKENCLLDIKVKVHDKKHWKSFAKTFKAIGGRWLHWGDHDRDMGPYSPSQGGDTDHYYIFDLKGIPIRLWPPCALCELP